MNPTALFFGSLFAVLLLSNVQAQPSPFDEYSAEILLIATDSKMKSAEALSTVTSSRLYGKRAFISVPLNAKDNIYASQSVFECKAGSEEHEYTWTTSANQTVTCCHWSSRVVNCFEEYSYNISAYWKPDGPTISAFGWDDVQTWISLDGKYPPDVKLFTRVINAGTGSIALVAETLTGAIAPVISYSLQANVDMFVVPGVCRKAPECTFPNVPVSRGLDYAAKIKAFGKPLFFQ